MENVRFTEEADRDLFGIYVYTYQTWGEAQADLYVAALKASIGKIAAEPTRPGTVDQGRLRPGLRSYHHQRHLIFYRAIRQGIEIIRILHDSMDVSSKFRDSAS